MSAPRFTAFAVALLCVACVDGPEWTDAQMPANYEVFVDRVQPILASRCANPGCHGRAGAALEIYAPGRHRLDPARLHLVEPLDLAELRLNFWRSCGFLIEIDDPKRCLLITKPLATAAGGVGHGGGAQFEDADEADHRALLEWVSAAANGAQGLP